MIKTKKPGDLLGRDADTNQLLGYARLMQQGASYSDAASIGRIVTHPKSRHSGVGQALMEENLRYMQHLFPNVPIRIGAQFQLVRFYERFGFQTVGEAYTEDTILHIEMVLKK